MIAFALGILAAMLAQWVSDRLGDNHAADEVRGLRWWQALSRIRPDPLDGIYGVPAGLLLGGWGVLLAAALALAYEWLAETRRGRTPGGRLEVEDVRDVVLGAALGALARAVLR